MCLLGRRHHYKLFTTDRIYHLLRSIITLTTACASGFAFGTLIAGAPLAATAVCSSMSVREC